MVDEVLADTGRTQQRIRDLPSRVVVYLLLGGALFPGLGWQQVWQRLTAGLDGLPTATPRRRAGPGPQEARDPTVASPVRLASWTGRGTRDRRNAVARTARLRHRRHVDGSAGQPREPGRVHQAPLQQWRRGIPHCGF
ncbi:transposase domain-containing protein [Streptomyces zhihengii]